MKRSASRTWILVAGIIGLAGLISFRKSDAEPREPRAGAKAPVRAAPVVVGPAPPVRPAPGVALQPPLEPTPGGAEDGSPLPEAEALIAEEPMTVEIPGGTGMPDLVELQLTDSQRTTIEALLREETLLMDEVRRDLELSGGSAEERVSRRAREIHDGLNSAVRKVLMPDQRPAFERMIRKGRWRTYALVVPKRP